MDGLGILGSLLISIVFCIMAMPFIENHKKIFEKINELKAKDTIEAKEEIQRLRAKINRDDLVIMFELLLAGIFFLIWICTYAWNARL